MNGIRRFAPWTSAVPLCLLLLIPRPAASQDVRRAASAGAFALELQGAPVGFLHGASGGDAKATTVIGGGSGGFADKHPGQLQYSDLLLEVGTGMEPAVYAWIASAWEGKSTRMSGAVVLADYNFQVMARREFHDALLAETALPALDASSKDAAYITLRLAPASVRASKGGGSVPSALATKQRPWLASNFRLEIPGLDCTRVRRIEPFRVGTKIATDLRGADLRGSAEPGALQVSDLVVTLPEAYADTWQDWMQSFLVDGKSDEEKSGDLVLLGTDLQSEVARVHLSGLGIISATHPPVETAGAIRNVVFTLYCERATLEWKGGTGAVMNVRVFGR